jgi:hypothetical protein
MEKCLDQLLEDPVQFIGIENSDDSDDNANAGVNHHREERKTQEENKNNNNDVIIPRSRARDNPGGRF